MGSRYPAQYNSEIRECLQRKSHTHTHFIFVLLYAKQNEINYLAQAEYY